MNQENNNKTWSMLVGSLIGLIVISLVASFAIILSSSTTNSNTTKKTSTVNQTENGTPSSYEPIFCTDFEYSDWSSCEASGEQYHTITKMIPSGCVGGSPVLKQKCKFTLTSNPTYLASPTQFLIDRDNIISKMPEKNKSVWVEDTIDERTIKISYFVEQGNENILAFAEIQLIGLVKLNDCPRSVALKFLKEYVLHKYVYLNGGTGNISKDGGKKMSTYVYMELEESGLKNNSDVNKIISDKTIKEIDSNAFNLNYILVASGYGITSRFPSFNDYDGPNINYDGFSQDAFFEKMKGFMEAANLSQKGFYGQCK